MSRRPKAPQADAPYPPGWEPFLAAINADLDDDTPRFVFADWLQENGDETRAELIRIQCALYRVHPEWQDPEVHRKHFTPEHRAAYARQKKLYVGQAHRFSSLPEWAKTTSWAFRRGFPYYFAPTALQWLKDGEGVRRQSATEELIITHTNPRSRAPWRELFASPSVFGLKELILPDLDSEGADLLTDSPALDSLSALSFGKLGKWVIESEDAYGLVGSPRLTKLRALRVTSNYVGSAVARALVKYGRTKLDELQLVCAQLFSEEFQELVAAPKLLRLRVLNVQGNGLGDSDVRALTRSKLADLEELNLRYNSLTAESARLLAGWRGLRSVRVLHLAGNRFGREGVRELLASKHLTGIEELELPQHGIGRREEAHIEALPEFERIWYAHFAS
jgi:uncharacterized protein (TIGR02996 family)